MKPRWSRSWKNAASAALRLMPPIINTIQEREYVQKVGGGQGAKFVPTEIGFVVTDLLVANFPYIFDPQYTAKLEEELDDIEDGKEEWTDLAAGFLRAFRRKSSNMPASTWKTSSGWRSQRTRSATYAAHRWC